MQFPLLCAAVFLGMVKIAATIWLVRQPDAVTVTATRFGRGVYLASKVSPALFVAVILTRAWLRGAPTAYILFCAVALIVAVVMAIVVVRKRAAGEWYGYAHEIRQRRARRRR